MGATSIVEVRFYHTKEGSRDEFVDLFRRRGRPAQESYGIRVLGPFLDLDDPNLVIWLRSFPSNEDRGRMKDAFYDGPRWKSSLEEVMMPLIDRYSFHVVEADADALARSLVP